MSSTSAPNPVWISKRDGCSQNGIEPAWRDVRQDQRDIGVEGMDMICRKTMARCQTPGMCSPHGGCQPDKGFEDKHLDLGKFVDWAWALKAERDQLFGMTEQLKAEIEALRKLAPSKEIVWCACGDGHAANSYGAGFMDANNGACANCDAAMSKTEQ